QVVGHTVCAPPPGEAQVDDAPLTSFRHPQRTAMRPAGPVYHRCFATVAITVGPFLGCGHRTLEPLSSAPQTPALINNSLRKPQPPTRSQRSISVDHEDLSVIGCACLVTTPIPEVLTYFRSPRRSQPVWELHLGLDPDLPGRPQPAAGGAAEVDARRFGVDDRLEPAQRTPVPAPVAGQVGGHHVGAQQQVADAEQPAVDAVLP